MATSAVVARKSLTGQQYLRRAGCETVWATADFDAETFPNFREATRAAMMLPGSLRAFALPVVAIAPTISRRTGRRQTLS
jgi:hypothetical protein